MNIFYLDEDMYKSAIWHNDKHSSKMILESVQLLCTAIRELDGVVNAYYNHESDSWQAINVLPNEEIIWRNSKWDYASRVVEYKSCHINHPCTKWVQDSLQNWLWLHQFADVLNYTNRKWRSNDYDHSSAIVNRKLTPPKNIKDKPFYPPPSCMKPEFKISDDTVANYRNYYVNGKYHLAKWTNRPRPPWYP